MTQPKKNIEDYKDCSIVDIRKGAGTRSDVLYAKLISKDGELLIGATLEYITTALNEIFSNDNDS